MCDSVLHFLFVLGWGVRWGRCISVHIAVYANPLPTHTHTHSIPGFDVRALGERCLRANFGLVWAVKAGVPSCMNTHTLTQTHTYTQTHTGK